MAGKCSPSVGEALGMASGAMSSNYSVGSPLKFAEKPSKPEPLSHASANLTTCLWALKGN
jgi:hypothetical protein